ncbi:MAG: AraC-like DNA-binding protein [Pseudohongiellaceae bacterium]|jgi:AraC-like DNA-binding protein
MGQVKLRAVYLMGGPSDFPSQEYVFDVSDLLREVIVRLTLPNITALQPHLFAILKEELTSTKSVHLPMAQDQRVSFLGAAYLDAPQNQSSLSEWADQLGYSRRTLIRRIKKETGMSFREYRSQARILASLQYLVSGESISNVALDVGFGSPSAFIQSFKAVIGKTPKQFCTESLVGKISTN